MVTVVAIVIILRHKQKMKQKYEELEWPDPDFSQYEGLFVVVVYLQSILRLCPLTFILFHFN